MKIDEAVDIINGTTTVKAKYNNRSIFVCFKFLPFDGHCFLALRADVKTWDDVTLVSGAIDEVIPEDLARVMDVVQRLLDTPVKERFPEKKYCLEAVRHYSDPIAEKGYVKEVVCKRDYSGFKYSPVPFEFTEQELKTMKYNDPVLAPAIDAMKVEVKDDED